ncbi:hypothetical protein [Vibrio ouci]|nr:hypothetical protein [Vibrio ouci]
MASSLPTITDSLIVGYSIIKVAISFLAVAVYLLCYNVLIRL